GKSESKPDTTNFQVGYPKGVRLVESYRKRSEMSPRKCLFTAGSGWTATNGAASRKPLPAKAISSACEFETSRTGNCSATGAVRFCGRWLTSGAKKAVLWTRGWTPRLQTVPRQHKLDNSRRLRKRGFLAHL